LTEVLEKKKPGLGQEEAQLINY